MFAALFSSLIAFFTSRSFTNALSDDSETLSRTGRSASAKAKPDRNDNSDDQDTGAVKGWQASAKITKTKQVTETKQAAETSDAQTYDAAPSKATVSPVTETAPVVSAPVEPAPVKPIPVEDTYTPPLTEEVPDYVGATKMVSGAEAMAGRVLTVVPEDLAEIESIRILQPPAHGHVSVNPDNTMALVLTKSDETADLSFKFEVTYENGDIEAFESQHTVVEGTQESGWGEGRFYMLETDENDEIVVETGDVHRKVFVSGSDNALSRADIAALEGLDESEITTGWLLRNPEYGGSEDLALDAATARDVWEELTDSDNGGSSNWLLFERGHSYDFGRVIQPGASGEDELHPLHITAYGEGERPILNDSVRIFQADSEHIVFSGVDFGGGVSSLSGHNVIFENVAFSEENEYSYGSGLTIRNSIAAEISHETPTKGGDFFLPHADRIAGLYITRVDNILIESSLYDQIGWDEGYAEDAAAEFGQAPSMYSQNLYFQPSALDLTFRDNITMRAASFGAQFRGGAYIEDNVFLDNNAAVSFLGGDYGDNGHTGNYSFFSNNVVTSGAHKVAPQIGGLTVGVIDRGLDSTLLDNIITHLADPNDPDDLASKPWTHRALDQPNDPFYDDTIIYNWNGQRSIDDGNLATVNTDGLDHATLDQTTIQLFAAELLGKPDATIADLADALRAQYDDMPDDKVVDSDLIIAFFQAGFGIDVDVRLEAGTLRFVPNELGDGIRWDNRLNWDTDDLPGTIDGDSVDLGGNDVNFGGTVTIENLDFGSGGKLDVNHGKLTIDGQTSTGAWGGEFDVSEAGQVWMDGYDDGNRLTINVGGGRFANTGDVTGTTTLNAWDGQTLLATDDAVYDLTDESQLNIFGDDGKVGFDGAEGGTGTLRMEDGAKLTFTADNGGMGQIAEFRSGAFGEGGPDIQSGVNLGQAVLTLDVTAIAGEASEHELIAVDGLIGGFSEIRLEGMAEDQDAQVVIDYASDTVTLNMLAPGEGSGQLTLDITGDAADDLTGTDLWDALTEGHGTYSEGPPTDLFVDDEEMLDA